VYGIVKQTGGFVYPDSAPGSGTTFRIFLPRHVPDAAEEAVDSPTQAKEVSIFADELPPGVPLAELPAARKAAPVAPASPAATDLTGEGTILLVEDEEGLRALNARGLKSRGYSVLEAGNGVEAIEALAQNGGRVDLVVSDVVMPEMDGPTMLKEMRKTNPALKIIFVSGYAEEAFAKSLPPNDDRKQFSFLPKPFTLKQLVGAVKEAMQESMQE
jgi:two-component system cell cycle sensor histidine kinase/response regulator CckA